MGSKNHEERGYNLDLDLVTSLHWSRVSYPRRSGLVKEIKR